MRSRTRFFLFAVAAVAALVVTGAALALSGLTYNKTAPLSVSRTAATVTGLVTCDPGDLTVSVSLSIIQGKGSQLVIGSGGETQACPLGGGTISWTVTAKTTPGQTFKPGSASVFIFASSETDSDQVSGPIKLTSS